MVQFLIFSYFSSHANLLSSLKNISPWCTHLCMTNPQMFAIVWVTFFGVTLPQARTSVSVQNPPSLLDFEPTIAWQWWGFRSLPVTKNRQWSGEITVASRLHLAVSSWANTAVCGSSRQCFIDQHCWFVAQASSVASTNTVGSRLKQAVFSYPSSRQWCLVQHCQLVAQAGSDVLHNTASL
jgi:hypothetical protein